MPEHQKIYRGYLHAAIVYSAVYLVSILSLSFGSFQNILFIISVLSFIGIVSFIWFIVNVIVCCLIFLKISRGSL